MDEIKIQQLIDRCIDYFETNCYTAAQIDMYKSFWKTGVLRHMEARQVKYYTPGIGARFVETCHHNGTIRHREREKIRSVHVLDTTC